MAITKKLLLLLGSLTYLGQSSATPAVEPAALAERATYGVWLDVYKSGACDSGWESQPTSGWVWTGECKNLESFTYGAKLGDTGTDPYWNPSCWLKFWEQPNCWGRATEHTIQDSFVWNAWGAPTGSYSCMAAANRGSEFYLSNGAASVELYC